MFCWSSKLQYRHYVLKQSFFTSILNWNRFIIIWFVFNYFFEAAALFVGPYQLFVVNVDRFITIPVSVISYLLSVYYFLLHLFLLNFPKKIVILHYNLIHSMIFLWWSDSLVRLAYSIIICICTIQVVMNTFVENTSILFLIYMRVQLFRYWSGTFGYYILTNSYKIIFFSPFLHLLR